MLSLNIYGVQLCMLHSSEFTMYAKQNCTHQLVALLCYRVLLKIFFFIKWPYILKWLSQADHWLEDQYRLNFMKCNTHEELDSHPNMKWNPSPKVFLLLTSPVCTEALGVILGPSLYYSGFHTAVQLEIEYGFHEKLVM